jgi:hypothetical protein
MKAIMLDHAFGRDSRNRLSDVGDPSLEGALAALESFYFVFNNPSVNGMELLWLDDPLVQMNNPVGGVLRGASSLRELYQRVFAGRVRVWVEFYDIVLYHGGPVAVFCGRERGEYVIEGRVMPLSIRTSRVFAWSESTGWKLVHHHGSIDDPRMLMDYQSAVRS